MRDWQLGRGTCKTDFLPRSNLVFLCSELPQTFNGMGQRLPGLKKIGPRVGPLEAGGKISEIEIGGINRALDFGPREGSGNRRMRTRRTQ
jgi:hypothetical protein